MAGDEYRTIARGQITQGLRGLSKRFGLYPKCEGSQSLEGSVQRNGMTCHTFENMALIVSLRILWGHRAEMSRKLLQ